MTTNQKPPASPLPLIVGGLLLAAIIGYGIYSKISKSADSTARTSPPVYSTPAPSPVYVPPPTAPPAQPAATQAQPVLTPTPTPPPPPVKQEVVEEDAEPDPKKAQKMKAQLKGMFDAFLKSQAARIERGFAKMDKSYYRDFDDDGFEDALFLYTAGEAASDVFGFGLVFFHNDGEYYVYAGHKAVGDETFSINSIDFRGNKIVVSGEESEMGEDESTPKTVTFFIRNGRLQ